MGVTVRTMQYYDKIGLLLPSAQSEGGLRLYTNKEVVKLHQILSMKRLGFTLEEIKKWLPAQNTPGEVSDVLLRQAEELREKIRSMSEILAAIEKLNGEVLQTNNVDWAEYAEILSLLQAKSELYWAAKHLSDEVSVALTSISDETADSLIEKQNRLLEQAERLHKKGISPESAQGQEFAKGFWEVTTALVGDDLEVLLKLQVVAQEHGDEKWKSKQGFIGAALRFYFETLGHNPFTKDIG
ncbi:MAG: MerR family transcriptional regulator [Oscillospiraceae bacterium]|nr:MerR family transcriptional regulator [Oscillospiraceae bacterium]